MCPPTASPTSSSVERFDDRVRPRTQSSAGSVSCRERKGLATIERVPLSGRRRAIVIAQVLYDGSTWAEGDVYPCR